MNDINLGSSYDISVVFILGYGILISLMVQILFYVVHKLHRDLLCLERWCSHLEKTMYADGERIDRNVIILRAVRVLAVSTPETDPDSAWRKSATTFLNMYSALEDPPYVRDYVFQVPLGESSRWSLCKDWIKEKWIKYATGVSVK